MGQLSDRQQEVLDFIRSTVADRGYPPSVREIGDAIGLSSPSTVHSHLSSLVRIGAIRRDPSKPRAIEIIDDAPLARPDPDDIRRQNLARLAEHSCLSLNPADAPADDSKAVYHGCVRIRPNQCIRKIYAVFFENSLRKVLKVDLMNDSDAGRHHAKPIERLRSPLQKPIPLAISLKFDLHVSKVRLFAAGIVHLHRMIDNKINRNQRFDHTRVLSKSFNRRTHRSQINQ